MLGSESGPQNLLSEGEGERKGLGNNLARKYLAGISRLNPANFIFRSLVRYYSNFQKT